MTQPDSQRVRVPIEEPQDDTSGRTGCLAIGAVLGVVAGILFVLFGVGPLLNFLFPTETIAVGEEYRDDKLTLRVVEVSRVELEIDPGGREGYVVRWNVEAKSSWSARYDSFVAVLEDGQEVAGQATSSSTPPRLPDTFRLPQGGSSLEVLFFDIAQREIARPESIQLEEPPVKFDLPNATTP